MNGFTYAQYLPIADWRPIVGDFVIWHGWFTHWFGYVTSIDNKGCLSIVKSGLPTLLMRMNQTDMIRNTIKMNMFKIMESKHGGYAAIQLSRGSIVWYI
jgi:hypothetical protein